MFTTDQKSMLAADLSRSHVKSRKQAGRSLSYIEGWHAIAEANRIFGFDAWSSETIDIRCVAEGPRKLSSGDQAHGVSYVAKVRVAVAGVIREGVGSGHGIDRDLGLAHESAIKEAETDARKRALMTFGNPFGLALYDKEQAAVSDAPPPRSEKLSASLDALMDIHTRTDVRRYIETVDANGALEGADLEAFKAAARVRWQQLPAEQKEAA